MSGRHSSDHYITRTRWELQCDVPGCKRVQPFWVVDTTGTPEMRAARVVVRSHETAARNDWKIELTSDGGDERHICPGPHTG